MVPGVDNIHYDVYLSPRLRRISRELIQLLMHKHSPASELKGQDVESVEWIKVRDEFIHYCGEVMLAGIHKAKQNQEIQNNFLVQAAVVKMLIDITQKQFEEMTGHYKNIIRKYEISQSRDLSYIVRLKEELLKTVKDKEMIIRKVSDELFKYMSESQSDDLKKIREANFGRRSILPRNFFANPIAHVDNSIDDYFMIQEYVLLGNRLDDPLKYNTILALLTNFFSRLPLKNTDQDPPVPEPDPEETETNQVAMGLERWINQVDNIDILFNYFPTERAYKLHKKQKNAPGETKLLKASAKTQKALFNSFYKIIKANKLMKGIVASYEMQEYYHQYCPPLLPIEVLKYLISPKARRSVIAKMKRTKGYSRKSVSLKPLLKLSNNQWRVNRQQRKKYLIRFLKDFLRFHRDLQNHKKLKEAMDWINLTEDEKTIKLSRVNRLLYEFLLPSEQGHEEKPVVNHVIIKADVRGSTDITYQIKERGLNPASYFSLNFFDPISAILPDYGASKVFIEGDAVILSIDEKEGSPQDWYSVARACGLAINILMITQRYNAKSKKHRLPVLEQGIGICFRNSPPTFLLDGEDRIMISHAINLADRFSGCSKKLRKKLGSNKPPFNLYVYQTASDEDMDDTADDSFVRFNINGIELNAEGFEKLKQEIRLQDMTCQIPELQDEAFTVYTGTFPTMTGKYQRLVIRESPIPVVTPDGFNTVRLTNQKYYEVCTNRRLYEHVKKRQSRVSDPA